VTLSHPLRCLTFFYVHVLDSNPPWSVPLADTWILDVDSKPVFVTLYRGTFLVAGSALAVWESGVTKVARKNTIGYLK